MAAQIRELSSRHCDAVRPEILRAVGMVAVEGAASEVWILNAICAIRNQRMADSGAELQNMRMKDRIKILRRESEIQLPSHADEIGALLDALAPLIVERNNLIHAFAGLAFKASKGTFLVKYLDYSPASIEAVATSISATMQELGEALEMALGCPLIIDLEYEERHAFVPLPSQRKCPP